MMLSDGDLQAAMDSGCLVVDPPGVMQPASIDLSLGDGFLVFRINPPNTVVWPRSETSPVDEFHSWLLAGDFPLHPGQFILGHTKEKVTLSATLAARIEGKSSLGRHGLMVHSTAGFVDPGFTGQLTLELSNLSPNTIMLTPGMFIAQLCVFELKTPARKPYGSDGLGSRYQGQQGPTASRSWMG